ncbi:response regulator [Ferrimonas lipolytica]|uniref:Response regulator n=1 Tax=Ferrimonas lipolytica TaxID=2724191 RepID=A0A6H1UAF0_9GAMM|nr:response regulator [Ferrimonas lipolytica]
MPVSDGIETTGLLQADSSIENVLSCIMVTAYGKENAMEAVTGVEPDFFLTKPVTPKALLHISGIGNSKAHRQP